VPGTKVQILTQVVWLLGNAADHLGGRKRHYVSPGTHFTCFTGTKVQILTQKRRCQAEFGSLSALTELNISSNEVTSMLAELCNVTTLTSINMARNKV
jgi:hypothetical protein